MSRRKPKHAPPPEGEAPSEGVVAANRALFLKARDLETALAEARASLRTARGKIARRDQAQADGYSRGHAHGLRQSFALLQAGLDAARSGRGAATDHEPFADVHGGVAALGVALEELRIAAGVHAPLCRKGDLARTEALALAGVAVRLLAEVYGQPEEEHAEQESA